MMKSSADGKESSCAQVSTGQTLFGIHKVARYGTVITAISAMRRRQYKIVLPRCTRSSLHPVVRHIYESCCSIFASSVSCPYASAVPRVRMSESRDVWQPPKSDCFGRAKTKETHSRRSQRYPVYCKVIGSQVKTRRRCESDCASRQR